MYWAKSGFNGQSSASILYHYLALVTLLLECSIEPARCITGQWPADF